MTILAMATAFGMLELDQHVSTSDMKLSLLFYTGGSDNARQMLSTIASSMITVAGVVFSVTVVALSLSSTQFGPRLLRTFMKDTGTQLSLGSFVSTYIYCLVVMRNVITTTDEDFIPNLSIALAIVLTIVNLMVLIYFIHNVSTSIQADHVIDRVHSEFTSGISDLFPEELGEDIAEEEISEKPAEHLVHSTDLRHPRSGYVQALDNEALWRLACRKDMLLDIHRIPGDHLVANELVMTVHSSAPLGKEVRDALIDAHILGYQRTSEQDLGTTIDQLVEIALRALSPSLNDPFTASTCIDRLCAGFCRLAGRKFPSPYRRGDDGRLRMITRGIVTFEHLFQNAFMRITIKAVNELQVLQRMQMAMLTLRKYARTRKQEQAIVHHEQLLGRLVLLREKALVADPVTG
jgi:uncharacterized membrane protein